MRERIIVDGQAHPPSTAAVDAVHDARMARLETERRLDALADLSPDWDSYGAVPPTPVAIARAKTLIASLEDAYAPLFGRRIAPMIVTALHHGGIELDWWGRVAELELDITSQGSFGYLLTDKSHGSEHYDEHENAALHDVVDLLKTVIAETHVA